jgi:general secretion pathway protein H
MRISGPGNKRQSHWVPACAGTTRLAARGFTLNEQLVVVAIIAFATAGVSFALRDSAATQLEREGLRLAALLETAREQSRTMGLAVRWYPTEAGFRFDGLPEDALPHAWLSNETRAEGNAMLVLGPEPIIGPQSVVITSTAAPDRALKIATDGIRPFQVGDGERP